MRSRIQDDSETLVSIFQVISITPYPLLLLSKSFKIPNHRQCNPSRQEIATVQSRSNSSLDKRISLFLNHRVDQDAYTQKETKRSEPRRWPRLEEEQEGLAEERQEGEGERQEGGKVRRRGREADVGA